MKTAQPLRIKSITEYHRLRRLPKPEHPLISVIRLETIQGLNSNKFLRFAHSYYTIALKGSFTGKIKYGQQEYKFDEGVMFFVAPGQILSIETDEEQSHSGWLLLVHPDYFWNTHLASTIKQYDYFSYSVHEGLHLSDKEEAAMTNILRSIEQECHANMDRFSHSVILAHLDLLLTYADRFYHRQFLTHRVTNHTLLNRFEAILTDYFNSNQLSETGPPTVQYIAEALHVSPTYLSSLLKVLTGQSTLQHIHDKLIEVAKEKLSTTDLSVSEIAYALGFEHAQSFNKLFKSKTCLSPLAFRRSFN